MGLQGQSAHGDVAVEQHVVEIFAGSDGKDGGDHDATGVVASCLHGDGRHDGLTRSHGHELVALEGGHGSVFGEPVDGLVGKRVGAEHRLDGEAAAGHEGETVVAERHRDAGCGCRREGEEVAARRQQGRQEPEQQQAGHLGAAGRGRQATACACRNGFHSHCFLGGHVISTTFDGRLSRPSFVSSFT